MKNLDPLAAFARRQHGLVTKREALTVLTRGQLQRRLRDRRLEPVRRGVYRVAGVPETWQQLLLAVVLTAGSAAYASFRAAAALFGLPEFAADVYEITLFGTRPAEIDGVIVHETAVVGAAHVTSRSGIPVTSVARTLCDLSAVVPGRTLAMVVDDALRRRLVTVRSLRKVARDLAGSGRRRSTVMRQILDERQPGYDPGGSAPEVRVARVLASAGLPEPVPQFRVVVNGHSRRLDLAYPELKLAIEYDGWEYHSQRSAFDADRVRANELEIVGWTVLRFTSTSANDVIVRTVAAALARAARS